ncbi:HAD superfamily hydrolase (TIGR01459 family) [Humitalea rosea]|uniref:HAD superfamily hydrolase (TIGR01459 family) n=1 Tax=Humitalea rosea TaxID=990373 RepID=A0A2W7IVB2_9PROT|nr:TIGR01459 family HAD-type hydrolase [Humitalea rosea]PZW50453.1 HAD superfamily hydrolase (TIGR01459 family) [Humitalea rosea]
MIILDGIADLAEKYDGFILDLWGVVHDGRQPYAGVTQALAQLQAMGKQVVFLSNAPRRAWFIADMLAGMGIGAALYDGIMTSGELTRRYLLRRDLPFFAGLGTRAFHIGPERDLSIAEGLDLQLIKTATGAEFVLNTGPEPVLGAHDVRFYEPALRAAAARKLPMICCNPDREVMVGGAKLIAAGALADRYAALGGGEIFEVGKPDPRSYPPVLELLGIGDLSRVVAIGDSPRTDLAGAQAAGIDAVWALTGLAAIAHGRPDPQALALEAKIAGVSPIAALTGLRW